MSNRVRRIGDRDNGREWWQGDHWWKVPGKSRKRADRVRVGDVLTGTATSGDFDFGPVKVTAIHEEVDERGRTTVLLDLDDGKHLGYWDWTPVEFAPRGTADIAEAGQISLADAADIATEATTAFDLKDDDLPRIAGLLAVER